MRKIRGIEKNLGVYWDSFLKKYIGSNMDERVTYVRDLIQAVLDYLELEIEPRKNVSLTKKGKKK